MVRQLNVSPKSFGSSPLKLQIKIKGLIFHKDDDDDEDDDDDDDDDDNNDKNNNKDALQNVR